jgi:hypothetical protein
MALRAVGLVDRLIAGGHGDPVIDQWASFEVRDLRCHVGILLAHARSALVGRRRRTGLHHSSKSTQQWVGP